MASGTGGLDLAALRRAWPEVLGKIFTLKRATWTFLSAHAQIQEYDGQKVVLGISTIGLVNTFRSGVHSDIVRQALIDVLGLDVRVEAIASAQPPPAAAGTAPVVQRPAGPARVEGNAGAGSARRAGESGGNGRRQGGASGSAAAPGDSDQGLREQASRDFGGPSGWGSATGSGAPTWATAETTGDGAGSAGRPDPATLGRPPGAADGPPAVPADRHPAAASAAAPEPATGTADLAEPVGATADLAEPTLRADAVSARRETDRTPVAGPRAAGSFAGGVPAAGSSAAGSPDAGSGAAGSFAGGSLATTSGAAASFAARSSAAGSVAPRPVAGLPSGSTSPTVASAPGSGPSGGPGPGDAAASLGDGSSDEASISEDDEDLAELGEVGQRVVERLLGATVIRTDLD